jgi:tetratricopeptide (TPR) repeat protein
VNHLTCRILLTALFVIGWTASALAQDRAEDARKYLIRGMAAVEAAKSDDELADAAEEFRKATEIAPQMADAWYSLGSVQAKMGKPKEAIASYKRYLAVAPQAQDAGRVKDEIIKLEYFSEKKEKFESRAGQWIDGDGNLFTASTEGGKLLIKGEPARSRSNIEYNDYMIFNFGGLGHVGREKLTLRLGLRGSKLEGTWEMPSDKVYPDDICVLPAEKNEVEGELDNANRRMVLRLMRAKYKVVQVEPAVFGSKTCQEVSVVQTRPVEMVLEGPLPAGGLRSVAVDYSGDMFLYKVEKNSAEDRAGLEDGDKIVAVDGADVTKMTYREKILKLRGQPGSAARVYIKGRQAPVTLTYTDVSTWK